MVNKKDSKTGAFLIDDNVKKGIISRGKDFKFTVVSGNPYDVIEFEEDAEKAFERLSKEGPFVEETKMKFRLLERKNDKT